MAAAVGHRRKSTGRRYRAVGRQVATIGLEMVPSASAQKFSVGYIGPMTAWIDYLIASDDPADQTLIDEHRARSWAYAQTMQWIVGQEGIKPEAFEKLQQENELANELQSRIHARGVELKESGAPAASDDQVAVWNAAWVPLVSNLLDETVPRH